MTHGACERPPRGPARPARLAVLCAAAAVAAGCAQLPGGTLARSPHATPPAVDSAGAADLRAFRIEARVGEPFEIRLPGNPSTGYRWTLIDPVPALLRGVGVARIERGRSDLAGAPGQEIWTFEATAPGSAPLLFEYRRPWEPATVPPAQRTSFRVDAR
jgi:inhibitor of cysteine peptidase